MNPDSLDSCFLCVFIKFSPYGRFGNTEEPLLWIQGIDGFRIFLDFLCKEIRDRYCPVTLLSLWAGDDIPVSNPVIGLGYPYRIFLKVDVTESKGKKLSFPYTCPVEDLKDVVVDGIFMASSLTFL